MVFFAAVAQFVNLKKANKKHILNACRVRWGDLPWDFANQDRIIGVTALILGLAGTAIWGFAEKWF